MKKVVIATAKNLDELSSLPKSIIIRAFKIVRKNGAPPVYGGNRPRLRYKVRKSIIERNFDSNPNEDCGAGLNVATMAWCRSVCYRDACNFHYGDKLITVEFRPSDIVCIPYNRAGKFRVKRLKVIKSTKVTWRKQ